jgi:hypothetical protein
MKYKLINQNTGEEFLCSKVILGKTSFFYTEGPPVLGDWALADSSVFRYTEEVPDEDCIHKHYRVIATDNDLRGIPKIIDETWGLFVEIDDTCEPGQYEHWLFKSGYESHRKTHPFSGEDLLNFHMWADTSAEASQFWRRQSRVHPTMDGAHNAIYAKQLRELFKLWESQCIKTLYFKR